jgi:hypothetical protein
MTGQELFRRLAPVLAPALEKIFERRDLCVLTTRIVMDVAEYFGIAVWPLSVRAVVYNRTYDQKLEAQGNAIPTDFSDGSWAVGIGFGKQEGKWSGHLIAATDHLFGDFSIGQAERPQKDILTGPAIVGPYGGENTWECRLKSGVVVEYDRIIDRAYRNAPDWRDHTRRRPVTAAIIRMVR